MYEVNSTVRGFLGVFLIFIILRQVAMITQTVMKALAIRCMVRELMIYKEVETATMIFSGIGSAERLLSVVL